MQNLNTSEATIKIGNTYFEGKLFDHDWMVNELSQTDAYRNKRARQRLFLLREYPELKDMIDPRLSKLYDRYPELFAVTDYEYKLKHNFKQFLEDDTIEFKVFSRKQYLDRETQPIFAHHEQKLAAENSKKPSQDSSEEPKEKPEEEPEEELLTDIYQNTLISETIPEPINNDDLAETSAETKESIEPISIISIDTIEEIFKNKTQETKEIIFDCLSTFLLKHNFESYYEIQLPPNLDEQKTKPKYVLVDDKKNYEENKTHGDKSGSRALEILLQFIKDEHLVFAKNAVRDKHSKIYLRIFNDDSKTIYHIFHNWDECDQTLIKLFNFSIEGIGLISKNKENLMKLIELYPINPNFIVHSNGLAVSKNDFIPEFFKPYEKEIPRAVLDTPLFTKKEYEEIKSSMEMQQARILYKKLTAKVEDQVHNTKKFLIQNLIYSAPIKGQSMWYTLHGTSATGKTTLIRFVRSIIGESNVTSVSAKDLQWFPSKRHDGNLLVIFEDSLQTIEKNTFINPVEDAATTDKYLDSSNISNYGYPNWVALSNSPLKIYIDDTLSKTKMDVTTQPEILRRQYNISFYSSKTFEKDTHFEFSLKKYGKYILAVIVYEEWLDRKERSIIGNAIQEKAAFERQFVPDSLYNVLEDFVYGGEKVNREKLENEYHWDTISDKEYLEELHTIDKKDTKRLKELLDISIKRSIDNKSNFILLTHKTLKILIKEISLNKYKVDMFSNLSHRKMEKELRFLFENSNTLLSKIRFGENKDQYIYIISPLRWHTQKPIFKEIINYNKLESFDQKSTMY